jgi:hypothetical protein
MVVKFSTVYNHWQMRKPADSLGLMGEAYLNTILPASSLPFFLVPPFSFPPYSPLSLFILSHYSSSLFKLLNSTNYGWTRICSS